MPVFDYVAKTPAGEITKSTIRASEKAAVEEFLQSKGLIVIDISKQGEETSFVDKIPLLRPKVKGKELLVFTKYFAILVKAGIPVLKSLKILEDQTPNPYFKKIIKDIHDAVTGGSSLFLALEAHPQAFPQNYRNLIRIGEESGALHEVLVRLHDTLGKAMKLKGKVIGAMVYPAVISMVAVAVMVFLLVVIIPKFVQIFNRQGVPLPTLTKIVVESSNTLVHRWYLILGAVGAAIFGFTAVNRTDWGKKLIHGMMLKPPVIGPLLTKYAIAGFAQNLDMLSRGGAPVSQSLKMAIKSVDNAAIRDSFSPVVKDVESGSTIARALEKSALMPALVLQMIAVGEETGSLNEMLETINNFYEEEIDASVSTLLSLIEPMFILFLGLSVGTIVISMYLPIFGMARTVSKH